jgi:hypothetical protein
MKRMVRGDGFGRDGEGLLGAIETGNVCQSLVSTVNTKRPVCVGEFY